MYYIVYIFKFHSGLQCLKIFFTSRSSHTYHVPCQIKEGQIRVAILINAILNNFLQFNFSINGGIIRRTTLVVDIYSQSDMSNIGDPYRMEKKEARDNI